MTNITHEAENTSVHYDWDASALAVYYEVELDGEIVRVDDSSSYVHENLIPGSNTTLRVRACNKDGKSEWSDLIIAKTTEEPLDKVIRPTCFSNDEKIEVMWDSVKDADYYLIKFGVYTGADIFIDTNIEDSDFEWKIY